jgi:hypothetical protein
VHHREEQERSKTLCLIGESLVMTFQVRAPGAWKYMTSFKDLFAKTLSFQHSSGTCLPNAHAAGDCPIFPTAEDSVSSCMVELARARTFKR